MTFTMFHLCNILSPLVYARLHQELHPGDAEGCQLSLQSMIYPAGSSADDNPMYVLCCNDTCSFTWTGAEHVNQVSGGAGLGWGQIDEEG